MLKLKTVVSDVKVKANLACILASHYDFAK